MTAEDRRTPARLDPRGRLVARCLVVLVVLMTAACASPAQDASLAAHDGLAATATAREALDQHERGRSTTPVLEVTLEAAATELSGAMSTTATLTPETEGQRGDLDQVRSALSEASDAVTDARSSVAAGTGLQQAREDVAAAERSLRDVVDQIGPPR